MSGAPAGGGKSGGARAKRRDAIANRERLLEAAIVLIRREGEDVPLARIAEEAGVGMATLYRHFPSREALLGTLTTEAFRLVREHARQAAESPGPALTALAGYFDATIARRERLLLPLHGGPTSLSPEDRGLQREIRTLLRTVLERGQEAGEIRSDVSAEDVIIAGAQAAQPLAHISDWDAIARRQVRLVLDGLAAREGLVPLAPEAPGVPDRG